MKLKNIAGVLTGAVCTFLLSTAVFAAPHFEMGTPIDLSTNTEITDYTVGTTVAVPIYVYTDSEDDIVNNFGLSLIYDDTVLTPTSVKKTQIADLGEKASNVGGLSGIYAVNAMYDADEDEAIGTVNYLWNSTTHLVGVTATGINKTLNYSANGNKVLYFMFSITGEVDDTVLNDELFKINEQSDATAVKISTESNSIKMQGEFTKANACAGAFQIVVDSADLPYYVKEIKANGTSLTACVNEDGTTTYKFPVRLIGTESDTAKDIEITAVVTDDEAGTVNETEVSWGTVSVKVDGSATSYENATGLTYNK